jgi:hypothetical protein
MDFRITESDFSAVLYRSRDGMVDIVISLRGGNWDNIVRFSAVARDVSLPQSVQSGTVAQQSRTHGVPEALSREIMGSGRESNRGVHEGNVTFHLTYNDPCKWWWWWCEDGGVYGGDDEFM